MSDRPQVLIVDDQPENIHALSAMLEPEVKSFFALTGEQALVLAQDREFDLILLDVMLPGIDGFSLCEKLKALPHTADVPVIFVSGLTEATDEERGFGVGGVDYIHKPFLPAVVRARVRTHLRLKALIKELGELARTDRLTGLCNRRSFEDRIDAEMEHARRHAADTSLVLLDIDNFKRINDQHGHLLGDRVLVEVGQLLANTLRRCDLVARWGGEEFVLMLPSTNLRDATDLAERLREKIAAADFSVGHITASMGVGQYRSTDTFATWFKRIDTALYAAKKQGRNRVCVESSDTSED
jgi:diguanylate cyclase (GGDEF)-like protein